MKKRLKALKAKHASLLEKMTGIIDAAVDAKGAARDLSADEQKAFSDLETEADAVEADIARVNKLLERSAAAGSDEDDDEDDEPASRAPVNRDVKGTIRGAIAGQTKVNDNLTIQQKLGIVLWGAYQHKCAPEISTADHMERAGYNVIADMSRETRAKALSSGTLTAGAELIPEVLAAEFIDFIRPKSSILAAGPTIIPLTHGNLTISGGDVGASASYRAEGADAAYTEATMKEKTLSAKNLSAVTSATKELLRRSPLAVASIVQNDLAAAFVQAMDLAALRGDGSSNTPTGLKNMMASGNKIAAAAGKTPSFFLIDAYASRMIESIEGQNVPVINPCWIMATRVANYLRTLRGATGEKIYPEMDSANPTFWGKPVFLSNQVPRNLGAGTNESEIYLTDMAHFWMGDAGNMEMSISEEASFVQGGNLVSAWSRNLVAIKINGSHDFKLRHDNSSAMLTGVQWGAP